MKRHGYMYPSVPELIIHGVLKEHSSFKNSNLDEFFNIECLGLKTTYGFIFHT